ncbi:MAG: hypothetical protein JWQ87_1923 [Candidatus Sulfotelmatobacter sp.]|nr:hypothetical protein [Candidatus Sulfotelmatobacter sp.]
MDALNFIDEEIRRLQQLRLMAEDPHMLELMRKVSGANGKPPVKAVAVEPTPKRPDRLASRGVGLTDGCIQAVGQLGGVFTIHEVKAQLENNGVAIGAAKPMIAISGVLQRLVERGAIEIVQKGKAGLPSQYRTIKTQSELPMG